MRGREGMNGVFMNTNAKLAQLTYCYDQNDEIIHNQPSLHNREQPCVILRHKKTPKFRCQHLFKTSDN